MFGYLVLLFTVVPALELVLLIKIGAYIGALNTLTLIILTGVAGATLARWQGFAALRNIQNNLDKGIMPTEQMLDGVLILVGGLVLLTPGFITDLLGFLLLIPAARGLIKIWIKRILQDSLRGDTVVRTYSSSSHIPEDFEDAEYH